MAKFDFVESAAAGYRFVWQERYNLLPLVTLPLAVKTGSYAAIYLLNLGDNILRQGLVLLPAYLLEGFVVILVIRMALFGEKYNSLFEPGGADKKYSASHSRAIMAGVVIYLLTKLVTSFLSGGAMIAQAYETSTALPKPPPSGEVYVTSIMIMVFGIWAFRFLWLYVPAALDIPVKDFLQRIRPFMTSVYMVGFWMLCFVPMAVILVGIAKALIFIFPGAEAGQASAIYSIVMAVVQPVIELVIALTSGVGMAYAVRFMMNTPRQPPRFF